MSTKSRHTFPNKEAVVFSSSSSSQGFTRVLSELTASPPLFNADLPTRRVVPTYLKRLDRVMRGGWSWQWPLIIAGPRNAGKSQLIYQFLASALLSYPPPWHCLFFDCHGDYRLHRIQNILTWRVGRQKGHHHLNRLD
ncbi:MAG: hypothetical protein ACFFBQ_20800, partial [Promethearchaeota archaeon]